MSLQTINSVVKIEKVPKLSMCRICLVENVRMHVVVDKSLQELYEKLTDVPFMTEDNRPEVVCFFCYAKLKQFCQLRRRCLQSEQQFMVVDYELHPEMYQSQLQPLVKFVTTPVVNMSIVEDGLLEKDDIKVEPPALSEPQYEVELIQLKGEPPDYDSDKEDGRCQAQEDFPLQQIKSEPEGDMPLMVMKFEEEEELPAVPSTSTSVAETPELSTKIEKQEMMDSAYDENNGLSNFILAPDNPTTESDNIKEPDNPTLEMCVDETRNDPLKTNDSVPAQDPNNCNESGINTSQNSATNDRPFKCDLCDKSFTKNYHLKAHIHTHTGEKPYECSICQKSFAKTSQLKSHILVHTGEKPYKCQICEKAFKKTNHLNLHLCLHSGEKPFQCEVCQKSFTSKDYLNKHAKIHSGKKPYDCTICQKIFAHLDSLKKHLRMHTGERPYKCDKCDLDFARKDNLNEHVRKHTGERPFKCHVCPKTFSRKETLRQHVCRHTGERAFRCYICQLGFIKKENLYKHLDRHISENHV